MSKSRTENVVRNMKVGMLVQIMQIILNFVSRTIFIKILGSEYLGVNGLFSNILKVLSFAELGIGNAIIFSMYKPIAQEDTAKINSLMKLYKKAYHAIGIVILIGGLAVIPFLDFIIKDAPNINENIKWLYVLFLSNTVVSYFFTYKKSIIIGYQKEYIVNTYRGIFIVFQTVAQSIFLVLTKNYIVYLVIEIIRTFLTDYLLSKKADKMYPYLDTKNAEELTHEERKNLFKNVKSLLLYKLASVILDGTDNIIISAMIGITQVGLYSNYTLIISAITTVVAQMLSAFTASIGNLNAIGNEKQKEKIFHQLFLISVLLYGFCAGGLMLCLNPFIRVWVGEAYVLSLPTVIAILLHFYINGIQFAVYTYRTTLGLFVKGKWAPLFAAIINIILSILLAKVWGLVGIFLATSIARLVTIVWVDPYLIYKYKFKNSKVSQYAKKYIWYSIMVALNMIVCYFALQFVPPGKTLVGILLKAILYSILSISLYGLVFFRTEELREIFERVRNMIFKKQKEHK